MLFTLEAVRARYGDSLLLHYGTPDAPGLIVIDGGPDGVYNKFLEPRLDKLRSLRAGDGALTIDLLMVSHIDDDHIRGILDLTDSMITAQKDGVPSSYNIRSLWHNSFNDIVDGTPEELFASIDSSVKPLSSSAVLPASFLQQFEPHTGLVLANVPQGLKLRENAAGLGLIVNRPFGSLVMAPEAATADARINDQLSLTVLGPRKDQLVALRKEWKKQVDKLRKAKDPAVIKSAVEFLDNSVFNLSSIIVLAKAGGKTMLLTGDARGDEILAGLEAAGMLKADDESACEIDLLKMPHHGSCRNVSERFFRKVRANKYVCSCNGEKFNNPDAKTLQMLSDGRGDDSFELYLTYPLGSFKPPQKNDELKNWFAAEKANGKKYEVIFCGNDESSINVDLGDPIPPEMRGVE